MAGTRGGPLQIGVTDDLVGHVERHRRSRGGPPTTDPIHRLVYYENHLDIRDAREAVAQLNRWRRQWMLRLIDQTNPDWRDLYEELSV
jgi:putative endonuclease